MCVDKLEINAVIPKSIILRRVLAFCSNQRMGGMAIGL
jgi:hypothetical protein